MKTYIAAILILALGTSLSAASDEKTVLARARSFIERIHPNLNGKELDRLSAKVQDNENRRGRSGRSWTINSSSFVLNVEDESDSVVLFLDGQNRKPFNGPTMKDYDQSGKPFYGSEKDLIAKVDSKLSYIGWKHGPEFEVKSLPNPEESGAIKRQIMYIDFYDRPNGYRAKGVGNFVEVGVDSLSGDIVEMQREVGYKYGPGTLDISYEKAFSVAKGAIDLPEQTAKVEPTYHEFHDGEELSDRAEQYCENKTLALAYQFESSEGYVVVAADTGEILSKRLGKKAISSSVSPKKTSVSRSDVSDERSQPVPYIVLIGIGLVLASAVGYMISVRTRFRPKK